MSKRKIIVYGLGNYYKYIKMYIENKFEVIAYCDSRKINMAKYIPVEEIVNRNFDYVCITSNRYFHEIKNQILDRIGEINENKIVSIYDLFGDFKNSEIREQWVIDKLNDIPKGKILLDAGAGEQKYKPYCAHLKYISQDFGKYIPNETNVGLQSDSWNYDGLNLICDIIDIPLEDNLIDVILCTEVFEHLKNPLLALKEFSRLIKPGGLLILTAPFCCLTHMAPHFYYNGFSEYWYKEHLGDNGFEIIEFAFNGNYFKYLCQELFRVESMVERYCEDKLKEEEISKIVECIDILINLSNKDTRSCETLCFGNMLVAVKL